MTPIASFHVIRHPSAFAAMTHLGLGRVSLARTDGLDFWRLLGTGDGRNTGPGADLRRTALFAMWANEESLDHYLANAWPNAIEAWHVRLRVVGGHGTWHGHDVLADSPQPQGQQQALVQSQRQQPIPDGPVAIITRADVRLRRWSAFRAAGPAVSEELNAAPGLIDVLGIGEAPVGRLGTFSLWDDYASARAFAYQQPHHRQVIRDTRAGRWYGEELFARFQPFESTGTWDGRDPLARESTGTNIP